MIENKHPQTVKEFIESVGRDRFQDVLGHSPQVVSRAISENAMPAHWFIGVRGLCNELGIMTPESLFKWSRPEPRSKGAAKQYANAARDNQVTNSVPQAAK